MSAPARRHDGTVAIVTGAGRGIGQAIALQLAAEGAAVAIIELDEAAGSDTAAAIDEIGARAIALRADIVNFAAVEAAVSEAAAVLGAPTLLVNNAAFTEAGSLASITLDDWHREVDVNLNGTYHCVRAVLPSMQANGGGSIVNIASVNALRYFGNPAYSAAKAGIISLTQAVASEYGRHGIRCNAVCPGSVRTATTTWVRRQQRDPEVFAKLARWYPLGRVGEVADIASAVAFLGSHEAAYISGAVLPVDGGMLAGMNVMIDEFVLENDEPD
jgi:NAD(P)-dependent dehydrogenase (short-subunit alcohol dehydrogenase family)